MIATVSNLPENYVVVYVNNNEGNRRKKRTTRTHAPHLSSRRARISVSTCKKCVHSPLHAHNMGEIPRYFPHRPLVAPVPHGPNARTSLRHFSRDAGTERCIPLGGLARRSNLALRLFSLIPAGRSAHALANQTLGSIRGSRNQHFITDSCSSSRPPSTPRLQ